MKTNKIFSAFIGFATFAFALSLNYKYASNDYGVLENTLSTHVLAQSSSGNGGGGSSNGGSSSGRSYTGGTCMTKVNFFDQDNGYMVTYDCDNGEGIRCVDGFEVWYHNYDGEIYLCYETKETTICK